MSALRAGRRRFLMSAMTAAIGAALPGCSDPATGAAASAATDRRTSLDELLDRMFQAQVRDFPEHLSRQGLDRGAQAAVRHRLGDRSLAVRLRYVDQQRGFLRELSAIDQRGLDQDAAVSLEAVRQLCASHVDGARFDYGWPHASRPYALSSVDGAYIEVPALLQEAGYWVETRDDAEACLSRLAALPAAVEQDSERAREDAARGVLAPDFLIEAALAKLIALRDAAPAQNALLTAFARASSRMPGASERQALATKIVQGPLRRALDRQIGLLERWRPGAADAPGVDRLRDGAAYYQWALRHNATRPIDAAELHRSGRAQIADLSARMDTILRKQGLSAGTVGARYTALAQDPRYRYPNTDEGRAQLQRELQARVRDLRPRLPRYFEALPRAGLDINRLPPIADVLRNPDAPRWELITHFYHETLGHHLQVALAAESPWVPMLINSTNLAAFHEGWGLYAEQLAEEMGIDSGDPLAALGSLRSQLIRAMHVVADTGLHAQGWSRDQAIAFVGEVSGLPLPVATGRVDRYCAAPGQGITFKVGHDAWMALRASARRKLGGKFDLRRFHEVGLRHGAVPLTVLESVVERWIATSDGSLPVF